MELLGAEDALETNRRLKDVYVWFCHGRGEGDKECMHISKIMVDNIGLV